MDAYKVEALESLIKEKGIVVNIDGITLSSGKTSMYYYDLKRVALDPVGANLIADLIFEEITLLNAKSVGGLEIGAIPITTAIIMKSASERELSGFIVRKHPKEHGLKYSVEGNLAAPVVIVDDVLTTGTSLMKAIQAVTDKGFSVKHVFCVLEREGNNALKYSRYNYTVLCKHSDFESHINAEIQRQRAQKIQT